MRHVTMVTAYFENADMLREQYARLRELPQELRRFVGLIVVDDCSARAPAPPPPSVLDVPVRVYRMERKVKWNQDACRNVGVRHAWTNWVLLTDVDHVVPEQTWRRVLTGELRDGRVYTFSRVTVSDGKPTLDDRGRHKPHPNSWLMSRQTFDRAGGYDERFAGWYGTDGDFRSRLMAVAEIELLREPLVVYPRTVIADASTVDYARKTPEDRENIARIKAERARDIAAGGARTMRFQHPYRLVL